eukprot:6420654-Prymnesium_polylepis.1
MRHAKAALHLLKLELSGGHEVSGDAAGLLTAGSGGDEPAAAVTAAPERMAVLAIAYHNLAVQQERLELKSEALRSFAHASDIASRYVGDSHAITAELRGAYEAASSEMVRDSGSSGARRRAPHPPSEHKGAAPSPRGRSAHERVRAQQLESVRRHVQNLTSVRTGEHVKPPAVPHVPRDPNTFVPRNAALKFSGDGGSVTAVLKQWMAQNAAKVMTVFKRWDADGNGTVVRCWLSTPRPLGPLPGRAPRL